MTIAKNLRENGHCGTDQGLKRYYGLRLIHPDDDDLMAEIDKHSENVSAFLRKIFRAGIEATKKE